METTSSRKLVSVLLAGALMALTPQWAAALGTVSGTDISNLATVNYKVANVAQPAIGSSPTGNSTGAGTATTFKVDDKVNFNIATNNAGQVTTYPGSATVALIFTVTNTGNTIHDFALAYIPGTANTFAADSITYYADSNANGTYEPLTDTTAITYLDELGIDAFKVVFLVAAVPLASTNGQVANYALKATAHAADGIGGSLGGVTTANSGTADTTSSVDVVFADIDSDGVAGNDVKGVDGTNSIASVTDGQYNGIYVMWAGGTPANGEPTNQGYIVATSLLTVTKTSAVYSDPINGTTNPKAIPGAIVTYTITVANGAGGQTATNVSISDSLNNEITALPARLAFNPTFLGNAIPCVATYGITVEGVCNTNAAADDNAEFTAGNVINVTGLSLVANTSATIKFQVTIQ